MSLPPGVERFHSAALFSYAAALALFEGPAQIMVVFLLAFAVLTGRAKPQRFGWFEIGILIWWFAGVPGLLAAPARPPSGEWTRPLMALAAFPGAWSLDRADNPTLCKLSWVFGGALVLNGAFGLAQFFFGPFPFDLFFLRNPSSGQIWIPGRVFHELAASGLYYNRLKLAHVGAVGLALFALIVGRRSAPRRARRAAMAGLFVLGPAVLLTYARMALLALAGGLGGLAGLKARGRTMIGLVGLGLLAVTLTILTPLGRARLESLGPDTSLRIGLFRSALALFADHPWLGVGHGVYPQMIEPYLPAGASGVHLSSPHNMWLQILAETGLIGGFGFVLAQGTALYRAAQNVRASRIENEKAVFKRWVWVGLLALTLTGLTHATLHHVPVALLFWTLAGAAGITRARPASGP